ncbi:3-dehydroquinate synthase [Litorilinea aerophila]|uniref:Multifunctional fusion protein n=1 Tax=Litorilinea aerophila TaxID=1204385 RepID=A0A540VFS9_9CHLR|nr:3-dehydroquinate synthase [Litorilinea aerophila]MCC9076618.1 3-dehydroquinate synthase [Litorilinea aerophila]GIV77654.1 MAG: bifunctional shikimate kinase/3-dehydroquinate synthase [Litorilinea sp.]
MSNFPATRNIVLTGFMGTGKTTVGRLLAERLNRPFVDMDDAIQAHFGKPIPDIFAQEGEAAFRAVEAELCRRFAREAGIVLSTGGGALVNPANREALAQTGVIICLTASVDEILKRVEQADDRPLLPGSQAERARRVRELLQARRPAYAAIRQQVDTTGYTPEQVVERVLEILEAEMEVPGMTRIPVQGPEGSYPICIGEGLLAHSGRLLRNRGLRPGPAAIVTNPMIAPHYAAPVAESLREAGFEPVICQMPEGEQHKTLETVASLYDQFLAAGLDRRSPVIALGGGVVGDTAGFAAATYLRGVPLVQIPTSLLAMVDSSVGGKTGVDLPQGKNLVGAFKQPVLVIIDPNVMATLPAPEFRAGLAEVIKHGIIGAPELFRQLEEHGPLNLTQLVADAVRVKVQVVEEDPFEQGRRATLNLGHTFGHAIELVSQFSIRHGEGVAVGLVAAGHMAADLGLCDRALADRITRVVERHELPISLQGYDIEAVMEAMAHDKKRAGKTLRFVVPYALGDVRLIDDPGPEVVYRALARVLQP